MTQETVTLKKIPGKEKQTDGQKTSFKHISVVERYCLTSSDGIVVHTVVNFCIKLKPSHALFES